MMNFSSQINSIIDKLSEKLGMTKDGIEAYIKQLYPLYSKQTYIDGIEALTVSILCVIFSVILIRIVRNAISKENAGYEGKSASSEELNFLTIIVFSIISAVLMILAVIEICNATNYIANANYWVQKDMLKALLTLFNK